MADDLKALVLRECQRGAPYLGLQFLTEWPFHQDVLPTFVDVMRHLYWKDKDLPLSLFFAQAGVTYSWTRHPGYKIDDADVAKARSIAKALLYDIASFTWIGWDEPGITITAADRRIGLLAADANLVQAIVLQKDALAISRACWMVGAQQWANLMTDAAIVSFQEASGHARQADNAVEDLLSQAYESLARLSVKPDATLEQQLDAIKEQLRPLQDGEFFIEQVNTARRVFLPN